MRKGDSIEELFITPETSVQLFIDEDGAALGRLCRIENGERVCDNPEVISMGPVMEIVTEKLPGAYRFVVAYLKDDGSAYVKKGEYAEEKVSWASEMTEEECWMEELWALRN
ncbi:MAG: hypothetical protein GY852_02895 [bacterium]|nr:hypothetical protein [bacterium]